MRFYADAAVRRRLQVTGDVVLVLWIALWIALARKVHDAALHLAGQLLREAVLGLMDLNQSRNEFRNRFRIPVPAAEGSVRGSGARDV